ncbi:MAG: calcium-binding protein [Acidimicrobiales bacterium]
MATATLLLAASTALPAAGDNAPGSGHTGPPTGGVHSLVIRSGVDPTIPAWPVIVPHSAYAPALPGTAWIGPNTQGLCAGAAPPNGNLVSLIVPFTLPMGALDPSVVVLVHADDSVGVFLNNTLIGGKSPSILAPNYQSPPETYTTSDVGPGGPFVPGPNMLRFDHRNYGGVCGLNFLAIVTFGFFACPQNNPGIIAGGPGDDVLTGTSGDEIIVGNGGDDVLDGGGGTDLILGGAGNDTLSGGAGDDCIAGQDGDDQLLGGDGNDTLLGLDGNDSMGGGPGDDLIDGGPGVDDLGGLAGNDVLFGGSDPDALRGDAGDDVVYGGADEDSLVGGAGNDALVGGDGTDALSDLNPNDRDALNGGNAADALNALDGDGQDTLWGPVTGTFYILTDPADACVRDPADYGFGCP